MIKKHARGQAIILIVFALVGLIAMVGLAVDGGNVFADRRHAQSTADNAALAAALAKVSDQDMQQAVENVVNDNNYQMSGTRSTVTWDTLDHNPTGCTDIPAGTVPTGEEPERYVLVVIHTTVDAFFAPIVGVQEFNNCVQAIAHSTSATSGGLFDGSGIVALAPDGTSFNMPSGSPGIRVHGASLFANSSSTSPASVIMAGNPAIYADAGYGINIALTGGNSICGWCAHPPVTNGYPQYTTTQINAILAGIPAAPNKTSLCPTGYAGSVNSVTRTISPGDFSGLLQTSGSGTYSIGSGVYCLNAPGSGLDVAHIDRVSSLTSDVIIILGDNTASFSGGTDWYVNSLEVYSNNGSWSVGSGTDVFTNKVRFISTGTGNLSVSGDTHFLSKTSVIGSNEQDIPDAFFYFTGGSPLWTAGASMKIHASTSGDFKGLLVYMPWSNTTPVTLGGGTGFKFTGTWLTPHVAMTVTNGTSAGMLNAQFVAYRWTLTGNGILDITYGASDNYSPEQPSIELTR
jgi:hypothetical protein